MISRKALLINTGGKKHSSSLVNTGLETIRNFLLSPRGGAWLEEEILIIEDPEMGSITGAVKEMAADYTITYFSGEGFADESGKRFLIFDGGDYIEDVELLNPSFKQLVLVDASHESSPDEVFHFIDKLPQFEIARQMYDKWIISSEPGQLIMHGTEQNSHSTRLKRAGVFTRSLLQVASSIPAMENQFNLKSILAVGNETPGLMHEDGPAISYENGNIKLPFAMAMPANRLTTALARNSDNPGLFLGLFLLGLLFSLK